VGIYRGKNVGFDMASDAHRRRDEVAGHDIAGMDRGRDNKVAGR